MEKAGSFSLLTYVTYWIRVLVISRSKVVDKHNNTARMHDESKSQVILRNQIQGTSNPNFSVPYEKDTSNSKQKMMSRWNRTESGSSCTNREIETPHLSGPRSLVPHCIAYLCNKMQPTLKTIIYSISVLHVYVRWVEFFVTGK